MSVTSKIPHVPNELGSALRRVLNWYRSASGILLAASLTLSAAFFILSGVTDSNWPAWIGLASTLFLGLFLPYRFARQQGVALDAVRDLAKRHAQFEAKFSKQLDKQAAQIERQAFNADATLGGPEFQDLTARLLYLEQRNENAELRVEKRISHLEAVAENPPVDLEELAATVARSQASLSRIQAQIADVQNQIANAKNPSTISS